MKPFKTRFIFYIIAVLGMVLVVPSVIRTTHAQPATFSMSGTAYKYSAIAANVLQGSSIFARNLDPSQPGSGGTSAADGTFTISGLAAGTYAIEARFTPNPADPNSPKDLVPPDMAPITISNANSTGNNVVFQQANNTVTGTVYRQDGKTVIASANVSIFSMTGGAFFQTSTGSDGKYTQKVGKGDFMVKAEPGFGASVDWMNLEMPKSVNFDTNTAPGKTATVDFTAVDANVTLKGKFQRPDGTALQSSDAFAMLIAGEGFGQPLQVDNTGSFSTKVGVGNYNVMLFASFSNPDWAAPRMNSISVTAADANKTKDIGTIKLIKKTDKVTGKVTRKDTGAVVSGVEVMGFQTAEKGVSAGMHAFMGGNFSRGTTAADGTYTLYVTPGDWRVQAMPQFGMGGATSYVPADPQLVNVTSGATTTANFVLPIADATVSGDVVDESGNALTNVMGFASVDTQSGSTVEFFGLGGMVMNGKFNFKVPNGKYDLRIFMPPGSGYCAAGAASFTVAANSSVSLTGSSAVKLSAANATISGDLVDENSTKITGKAAQVFAQDDKGNFVFGSVSGGSYSLKVCAGTWKLNFSIDPATGYVVETGLTYSVKTTANTTTTQNLSAKTANSTISGTTVKSDGIAVAGAFVTVDSRADIKKAGQSLGLAIGNSTVSDDKGAFTLKVPAGTYKVRASRPISDGLINPKEEKVTVSASSSATGLKLVFESSDAKITGSTTTIKATSVGITSSHQPLVYCTAWSEKGGYTEAQTDTNGAYTLNVTNDDIWHVSCVKEDTDRSIYESTEVVVPLSSTATSLTQNIELKDTGVDLPKAASQTCSSTNTCTLKLSDGTIVTAPGGSLANSGNVTISATPTAMTPETAGEESVLPYAPNFVVTKDDGSSVQSFNSQVSLTLPYQEKYLTAEGVTEAELGCKSWDVNSAAYVASNTATVDTTNNTMTCGTDHFSTYALTAKAASVPSITVTSPKSGDKTSKASVDIVGTVSDPTSSVTISVDGTDQGTVTVNSTTGAFTKTVNIATGLNTVMISAKNIKGTSSTSLTVENTLPTLTRVGPKAFKVDKRKNRTVKLTIVGTYFVEGAKVKVGTVDAKKVKVNNSKTIVATLQISELKKVGKHDVTVTNPDGGSVTKEKVLTIRGKKPIVNLAGLVIKVQKSGTVIIIIPGKNFAAGTIAYLNGKDKLTTKVVSSKKLQVTVPAKKSKSLKKLVVIGPDDQKVTVKRPK